MSRLIWNLHEHEGAAEEQMQPQERANDEYTPVPKRATMCQRVDRGALAPRKLRVQHFVQARPCVERREVDFRICY
jgi:hypothetical protein